MAFNFPGNKVDLAVSDIINWLTGKGASVNTEILTSIFGEQNRETIKYISEHIIFYPYSEEWKMKQDRKGEREDETNGNKHGYANKGSLQYPMINNIYDDWEIIWETLGQRRGFIKFTPQ